MKKYEQDEKYLNLVEDILNNDEFKKLKDYKHHGDNRMNHCIRVSYYSYLLSNKLKLNYKATARAGLLHDFFMVNNQEISLSERIKVLVTHPKIAAKNSKKYFNISKIEENIILSHMFPIYFVLPKYKESILVDTVDNFVAIYERYFTIKEKIISSVKNLLSKSHIYKLLKVNN